MRQLAIIFLACLLMGAAPHTDKVNINTVVMPPYINGAYSKDGGTLLNLTEVAFTLAKVPYEIKWHTSWDSAVDTVNLKSSSVFVADINNSARENNYQTINTYIPIEYVAYINKDNYELFYHGIDWKTVSIGVVSDRLTGDRTFDRALLLNSWDFQKHHDADHLLTMLLAGKVDVAVLPREEAEHRLQYNRRLALREASIVPVEVVSKQYLHLFFNKSTPKEVVENVKRGFTEARKLLKVLDDIESFGE